MVLTIYGMLPQISPQQTVVYLFLAALFFVVLDARPTQNIHSDEENLILDAIRQKLLGNIEDKGSHFDNDIEANKHIRYINANGEQVKHRAKRIGIAGHENIDMMISTLERQKNPSFHPGLSMSGNMGSLQRLMNTMRNAG